MNKKQKWYTNLYIKRRVLKLDIDMVQIISQGIISHTPKRLVLTRLKRMIIDLSRALELDDLETNRLWLKANELYNQITRKTYAQLRVLKRKELDTEGNIYGAVYASIRAMILQNDLIKDANQLMYQYEYRHKHDYFYGQGGLLANATSPFFLASSHPKPAKDHADWEGKMYYDEDWETKNEYDSAQKKAIRAYIRNRKLRSVQWVLGEPVYLCTRRNCKHYLRNIPLDECLSSSPRALLQKKNMYMPEDKPVSQDTLNYREYYNRLKIEEALHQVIPNQQLKLDIRKDKKILDKYK